jgi:para-aminobenzoate synthetase component 1
MNTIASIFIPRPDLISRMNRFSSLNQPFVFAIDSCGEKGFVLSPEEAINKGFKYNFQKVKNSDEKTVKGPMIFDFVPVDFPSYLKAYEKVVFHLKRGDSYLLNLTFPSMLRTELTPAELYDVSIAPFKLYVPNHFVVFSPEAFVHIADGRIKSCPMKGTMDASIPDAEKILLEDRKEFFEHNTIVDLIRNDLSMVATNVEVTRFRYVERLQTNRGDLLQMSSEISGKLPHDYCKRLGEILFTLLPAGSVTGAPKEKTVAIIRAAEPYERGFYTGIFGYFDGSVLTSAVSIRFIEQTPEGLVFKSGGGITALSDPGNEYREMQKKIYVPVA